MSKTYTTVALLAEGVDRNPRDTTLKQLNAMSPSSRRAWIEIPAGGTLRRHEHGRPPRGGRG